MSYDQKLFKNKKLSDIFEEIYKNSVSKKRQIDDLIAEVTPLIDSVGDAVVIVPLIKEYLDVGVKNNEHLIKLASIVQRLEKATPDEGSFNFEELEHLLESSEKEVEVKEKNKGDGSY